MTDVITSTRPASAPSGRPPAGSLRRAPSRVPRRSLVLWCTGVLLVVLGSLGAVALSRAGDRRSPVLVVSHDVPAGAQLSDADLAVVSVSTDSALPLLPATSRGSIVGGFLKVRLLSGQFLSAGFVQPGPLVTAGKVVVALPVTALQVPFGMHELSRIEIVVVPAGGATNPAAATGPFTADAVVVRYPQFGKDGSSTAALSVEVDPTAAVPLVSAGRNIALVLVDPTVVAK